MKTRILFAAVVLFATSLNGSAQLTPFYQYSLLNQDVFDVIIGESSGETALNHVIEMVGYQRNRPESEYGSATFREAKYVVEKLNEYGLSEVQIERFEGGKTWDGIKGELWEVSPEKHKLADYDDIALSLAQGSVPTDVTADLIWVEEGLEKDFAGLDVNNKIVVTSGSLSRAHNIAVEKGALGVIGIGSSRELTAPLAIPASGIRGNKATFGFYLTPREGYKLRDRLIRGEIIRVHAVVDSKMLDYDLQVPTCVIFGTNPDAGEIILSAHIFEGYVKQGANDNVSGSATILEVARLINHLINTGRIERPQRSIRFVWVPEYSGTIPWVKTHQKRMEKTLCNINLDMVGLHLKSNNSFFSLMRTTFGNPHYINDVLENYFVYMGEVNREILANRHNKIIANQIIAPSGTDDPFYYQIEQHYGSSDHEVFNHWSTHVPGVMLITWPDMYYHTSQDIPNKLDATQLKRAAIIAAAGAYTVAAADENSAESIAECVFAHSNKRLSIEMSRVFNMLEKTNADNFQAVCKQVKVILESTFENEKATLGSVLELAPDNLQLAGRIDELTGSLETIKNSNWKVLLSKMNSLAKKINQQKPDFKLTELEKKAVKIIPERLPAATRGGFGVERSIRDLPDEMVTKYPIRNIANRTELCALIDGKHNALQIKQMLDTQFETESDLQSVINYLELLKIKKLVAY